MNYFMTWVRLNFWDHLGCVSTFTVDEADIPSPSQVFLRHKRHFCLRLISKFLPHSPRPPTPLMTKFPVKHNSSDVQIRHRLCCPLKAIGPLKRLLLKGYKITGTSSSGVHTNDDQTLFGPSSLLQPSRLQISVATS